MKVDHLCKTFEYQSDGIDVFNLFCEEPYFFFLDSSLYQTHRGRFSFIGFDPFHVVSLKTTERLDYLKKEYLEFACQQDRMVTPLGSGIVGYLSYDLGLSWENISMTNADDLCLPDCVFGFYDVILTIDHLKKKLYVTSTGLPEQKDFLRKKRAKERLNIVLERLQRLPEQKKSFERFSFPELHNYESSLKWHCNFTKQQYMRAVTKALEYITKGDIYQVNLSQRFQLEFNHRAYHAEDLYKLLRKFSPSQFASYFDCGDSKILSTSPEQFLNLRDRFIQTRPMKGTRPRGKDTADDVRLKEEIIRSRKDQAELLMITDLERNDLGRVCEYGSVRVQELRAIEEYRTVFQATSTVGGILQKSKDAFDVLHACFPGGSITGCPKIRAMEIIDELEPTRRGMYTGSLGYISFTGDMDFNILIRTMVTYQDKIYLQVGGGIVADSTPENEYHETLVKANAMRACLEYFLHQPQLIPT